MSAIDTLTEPDVMHLDDPVWRAVVDSGVDPRRLILAMTRVDWPGLMNEALPSDRSLQKSLRHLAESLEGVGRSC